MSFTEEKWDDLQNEAVEMDQRKMNLKAKVGALPEDLNLVLRTELRWLTTQAPADLTLSRPPWTSACTHTNEKF